jgi:anti-sigma regulatory factor (Ser/Thr protein kinase)
MADSIVKQQSGNRIKMSIVSDPMALKDARLTAEAFAAAKGGDQQCCFDLGLCINEALANVMRHAYRGAKDRPIEIEVEDSGDQLIVRIRDWGEKFDPKILDNREYDPHTPGGLGVICMMQLMDGVTWTPQSQGMLLTLKRKKVGSKVSEKQASF